MQRVVSNPHLAEERGMELDIDEEERYVIVLFICLSKSDMELLLGTQHRLPHKEVLASIFPLQGGNDSSNSKRQNSLKKKKKKKEKNHPKKKEELRYHQGLHLFLEL